MAIIPNGYLPFYIQKAGSGNTCKNSLTEWDMAVKSFPFKYLPEAKDPSHNDWYDENGNDEYVPSELKFKAYDIDVEFIICEDDTTSAGATTTSDKHIRTKLTAFFNYIKSGEFKIVDSYTGIGRQHIRYVKFDSQSFRRRADHAMLVFKVTFKVNDPITNMKYNGTGIVTE